jgi:hypothetical protein
LGSNPGLARRRRRGGSCRRRGGGHAPSPMHKGRTITVTASGATQRCRNADAPQWWWPQLRAWAPSVVRLGSCLAVVEEADVEVVVVEADAVAAPWRRSWWRPTQSSWWWKPTPSPRHGGGQRGAHSGKHVTVTTQLVEETDVKLMVVQVDVVTTPWRRSTQSLHMKACGPRSRRWRWPRWPASSGGSSGCGRGKENKSCGREDNEKGEKVEDSF